MTNKDQTCWVSSHINLNDFFINNLSGDLFNTFSCFLCSLFSLCLSIFQFTKSLFLGIFLHYLGLNGGSLWFFKLGLIVINDILLFVLIVTLVLFAFNLACSYLWLLFVDTVLFLELLLIFGLLFIILSILIQPEE